jgi:hypothetical protein
MGSAKLPYVIIIITIEQARIYQIFFVNNFLKQIATRWKSKGSYTAVYMSATSDSSIYSSVALHAPSPFNCKLFELFGTMVVPKNCFTGINMTKLPFL